MQCFYLEQNTKYDSMAYIFTILIQQSGYHLNTTLSRTMYYKMVIKFCLSLKINLLFLFDFAANLSKIDQN